ncbi:MAG: GFA family protein [Deltaproteobacteria bacterium]|nr:GFA family protein [Deltaproteobacteria bacterium]
MKYHGSCHCGRITYDVEGEIEQAVECNCSHCSRKGYLLWFVPREQLTLSDPEVELSTYTFNKHVIKHHFCSNCGCAPFGFGKDSKGNATAAVNLRCIENLDLSKIKIVQVDGRSR